MHEDPKRLPQREPRDLFELGRVVATPAALELMSERNLEPLDFINRHRLGDWGDVDESDRKSSEAALNQGERLFSSYNVDGPDTKVWVITEWDRSFTTLLTPQDY